MTLRAQAATIAGTLSADRCGFKYPTIGPGGSASYGGSGYGGNGGWGIASAGLYTYGQLKRPTALGSSGYNTAAAAGGGAIKVDVSGGALTVNGKITASAANVTLAGSGGSIWLVSDTFSGSGTILAKGGYSGPDARQNGGGGRIAIENNTWSFTGTISAAGGADSFSTQPGTLWAPNMFTTATRSFVATTGYRYFFPDSVSAQTWSLVNTNGVAVYFGGFTNATWTVTNLYVANGSVVRFDVNASGNTDKTAVNRLAISSPITVLGRSLLAISEGTVTPPSIAVTNSTLNFGAAVAISNVTRIALGASSTLYAPEGIYPLTGDLVVPATAKIYCRGRTTVVNAASGGTPGVPHGAGPRFSCQNATIAGLVSADLMGFPGGKNYTVYRGPGNGTYWSASHGGGKRNTYGSLTQPTALGSGDDSSEAGGGAIKIAAANTLTLNGTVTANGQGSPSGSGAGGSVWLTCVSLSGTGTVSALGGSSSVASQYDSYNRSGGGGRISIECQNNSFQGAIKPGGGCGPGYGFQAGGMSQPGTLWFPKWLAGREGTPSSPVGFSLVNPAFGARYWFPSSTATQYWNLRITNSWLEVYGGSAVISNLGVTNGCFWVTGYAMSNLAVRGAMRLTNATVYLPAYGVYDLAGDLVLADANTIVYAVGNTNAVNADSGGTVGTPHGAGVSIACANASIAGQVNAEGLGFPPGAGPGKGLFDIGWSAGGSHGGWAGKQGLSTVTRTYGSLTSPSALGSGGFQSGSVGGGAVKIRAAGTLALNGAINARGTKTSLNGGAGGSVWLMAGTLSGNGRIMADGGPGAVNYSGGGGGRIALEYGTWNYTGTMTVTGGMAAVNYASKTGTVFRCRTPWLGTTSPGGFNGVRLQTQFSANSNSVAVVRTNLTWGGAFSWIDVSTDVRGTVVKPNRTTYTLSGLPAGCPCRIYDNGVLRGGASTNVSSGGILAFTTMLDGPHLLLVQLPPAGSFICAR